MNKIKYVNYAFYGCLILAFLSSLLSLKHEMIVFLLLGILFQVGINEYRIRILADSISKEDTT